METSTIERWYTSPFPTLHVDPHFILREHTNEDAPAFLAYYSDPKVGEHILATKPRNLVEAAAEIHGCRSLFYDKKGIYWSIARKTDNIMIGAIGLYINALHRRAEVCYDLAASYWNQGIMTRVMRIMLDYLFNEVGLTRIEATTIKKNRASITLLKKLGFKHEGTLKKYRHYQDSFHDIEMYAVINPLQTVIARPNHSTLKQHRGVIMPLHHRNLSL